MGKPKCLLLPPAPSSPAPTAPPPLSFPRFSTSDDRIAENAPWEGLLALELMLMLLAIGGIGLLCYAWKKYKKFEKRLENLRRTDQYYATTTSNPNLTAAPIFIPPLKVKSKD